jgi:hypothetical protein
MKKIIGIFVMTLLIGTIVIPLASSTDKNENDNNIKILSNLPDYFNWRDHEGQDWTTPAKDQGNLGSCSTFASMGVLETLINIRENNADLDMDLSEQYILSCLLEEGSGDYNKIWGNMISTEEIGNYHNGAIPESCFPYEASYTILCEEKCENWVDYLVPIYNYGSWISYGISSNIDTIKTQIMELGPVMAHMFTDNDFKNWGSTHHSPNDYFPYTGPIDYGNHMVVMVGWKDDPSISNGGYWICKNSWGTFWGYDGFFNIEYGSQKIDEGIIFFGSVRPNDLSCYGDVIWQDILPGSRVNGTLIIENIGESGSILDWRIVSWPEWGETWKFETYFGENLKPEDEPVIIEISCDAPNEQEKNLIGNITIINMDHTNDYEIVEVSLTTSKSKSIIDFNPWLLRLIQRFPILELLI